MLAIARTHGTTYRIVFGLLVLIAAAPLAAQVDHYSEIDYPELPEFEIPRPETYDLPSGMKVFLMEDHELPLIQVIARIRTGELGSDAV